jgi:hypothetical protein
LDTQSVSSKTGFKINASFIKQGVFFLTVSALLFGTKSSSVEFYGIPIPPMLLSNVLGAIAIVFSAICMVATFWERLAKRLRLLLDRDEQVGWYKFFVSYPYWLIFWLVYTIGWLKALPAIMDLANKLGVYGVFYVGFLWFLIISAVWFMGPSVQAVRLGIKTTRFTIRLVSNSRLWNKIFR